MRRVDIQGHCDSRFSEVAEQFERNFAERGELGASVAISVGGDKVVDLWGGHTDAERTASWDKDTLCVVMSCTKGLVALCAHLLAIDGVLDFDERVATYWPEFAQAGKQDVLVGQLLSHQVGVVALRDPVPPGGFYDWDDIVRRLAAEEPFWSPGSRYGYHALTFGFLVGEVIRRVTGKTIGAYFRDEVARPLGLDLHLGLPMSEHGRVATLLFPPMPEPGDPISRYTMLAVTEPESIPGLIMQNNGGYMVPGECVSPDALSAELPSTGAVGNARSLEAMYRAIVHDRQVGRFTIDAEDLVRMGAVASAVSEDAVLFGPGRWTLGFHKCGCSPRGVDPAVRVMLSEDAFGHTGMGGSIGFCDPPADLSFAYVMNQMANDMGLGPTGQSLVDAAYRAIGYRKAKYDTWVTG